MSVCAINQSDFELWCFRSIKINDQINKYLTLQSKCTFQYFLGYSHPVFDFPLIDSIYQSTTNSSDASFAVDGKADTCAFTNEDNLGQAHHMFSWFLNLRIYKLFSLNFLCFVFLQGRCFLLISKMLIYLFIRRQSSYWTAKLSFFFWQVTEILGPKLHPRGGFFGPWFFIILKNSHQYSSNEGSNFILSSLEVGHWVAQT